ncbi:hypothetical protein KUTeg_014864 [Tegillarca granosa]|uniref:Uncharacterized protein n=1 Tax=Tegillarca granosa TaxID=220873 RepID=A0ABQ9EQT7_TEGGR|nr:hypothetical protein KUTeg_014864 [Tegillarca granosa]
MFMSLNACTHKFSWKIEQIITQHPPEKTKENELTIWGTKLRAFVLTMVFWRTKNKGRRQRYHDNRKTDRATKEGVHRKNDNTTTIKGECKQCGKPSHKPGSKCPALAKNPFNVGEKVRFQKNDSKWQPAIITGKEDDHSYTLRSQYGGIFRRNRRHLIKSNEDFDISLSPSYKVYDDNPIPSKTLVNSPNVKFDIPKDDPKVKDTTHKDQVQPPPVVKYEPIHTQGHSQPYITRSGRIVKPKIIKSIIVLDFEPAANG